MLRGKFTKQYRIGSWVGGAKDLLGRTLFYVTAINFILLAVTAYHTTLRDTLLVWIPWLNFPIFIGVLMALLLVLMIIEYKFILPSTIVFLNRQAYTHQNLVRRQLDRVERTLAMMQKVNKVAPSGSARFCNICGWQGEQFITFYNTRMCQREEALCPDCNSLSRQRALFKYLQGRDSEKLLCLEIAPHKWNLVPKALIDVDYISIDLNGSKAMLQMDLTNLTFADNTFDLVVCSHVLEHIKDDIVAISEIYRVLKKNGIALIQIPIGYYKDPLAQRTIEFNKSKFYGHFRSYGWDFSEKLTQVGFEVNLICHTDSASTKLGIEKETIFECRKVGGLNV